MKDVNHFFAVLRELTSLSELEWSPEGHAEIVFDDDTSVTFVRIDDTTVELTTPIDQFDSLGPIQLRRALEANYLGDATGAARLAVDPRDGGLVLCERLQVDELEPKAAEARILGFVKHALFWADQAGRDVIGREPGQTRQEEAQPAGDVIFRL